MTILEFFKTVHPSVLAAKMIFRHLQEHYPVLKISDIADTTSGGTPNRGMLEYYNGDIPWIKSGELKDGLITNCDEYITEAGLKNSSAKLFPKGTLLVAMYGANIGKTGILDFDATTNQAVCAIFPKVDISRDFLFWYFKQQRIDFIAIGKGGAQPNISQTVINNASIVVPKPDVQSKIVKFLERIEKGNGIDYDFFIPYILTDVETIYKYKNSYIGLSESFETQMTQLESLNQAILQEAVQGKLVKQDSKDEPASELLKRIKTEKAKSGKKEKPLPPIKPEEIPFEIPENWIWCRLGEIIEMIYGDSLTKAQCIEGAEYPVFGSNGIVGYYNEYLTDKRTIIVGRKGSAGALNVCHSPSWTTDVAYYIEESEFLNFEFTYSLLKAIKLEELGKGIKPGVNRNEAYNLPIPLPPLSEQKRIVEEIEKQITNTKQLNDHIIANQQAAEQLLKALLHQTFEIQEAIEHLPNFISPISQNQPN